MVSTHSRPKAAASPFTGFHPYMVVSTHSRPKAAARINVFKNKDILLFQHTAARRRLPSIISSSVISFDVSTHSRPKAAASTPFIALVSLMFQHTAARRRLLRSDQLKGQRTNGFNTQPPEGGCSKYWEIARMLCSFNTQPPEGGCFDENYNCYLPPVFQHTAARRRLRVRKDGGYSYLMFQHTAARRRLHSDKYGRIG